MPTAKAAGMAHADKMLPSKPSPLWQHTKAESRSASTAGNIFQHQRHPNLVSFLPLETVMSSPESMTVSDLEISPLQSSFTPDKGDHWVTTPATSPDLGLFRRHTISSSNISKAAPPLKRTYLQPGEANGGVKRSLSPSAVQPRAKIARSTSHPSEVHRPGQKVELLALPAELLATIISYVIESPPPGKHSLLSQNAYARVPTRRWTIESTPRAQPNHAVDFNSVFNLDRGTYHDEIPQHQEEAFYPSRMLNSIASTCHRLRKLVRLKEWDIQFWRSAAQIYYHIIYYPKILPDSLDLIQGSLMKNQTSWRNFLTCTVQYIDTRKRGVESFGTKAGCKPAISWKDYQAMIRHNRTLPSSPTASKLMMLCRQPGPDIFDIIWDATTDSYTIAMGLDGGKAYASVDRNGNFNRGEALLPNFMRSLRGLFPPDILEVKRDRFSIVKIAARKSQQDGGLTHAANIAFQEVIRWDLSCVPEVVRDNKARIARCASWDNYLCFTLFKQNFADPTAAFLDPDEDNTVYCIRASPTEQHAGITGPNTNKFKSELLWVRDFKAEFEDPEDDDQEKMEPAVCHVTISRSYAAVLVRWNTASGIQHIVDHCRKLYIIDLKSGKHIRRFNLPEFVWDFRHSDMGEEYNQIRLDKLRALYDDRYATHRATRVHDDKIILLESSITDGDETRPSAKIITGSHDYCNWVWDLNQDSDCEPLMVLDDFYWDEDTSEQQQATKKRNKNKWNRFKERAGWWCSTPNQVLDFWHDFSITPDGRYFAAIRAGRSFIWDLCEERPTIKGFTCELDEEEVASPAQSNPNYDQSLERYLGRPTGACDDRHGHMFSHWFEYKNRIPEQGLWMVFDDWSVVYLDRKDILGACGLSHREWIFSDKDFESINPHVRFSQSTTTSASVADEDSDLESDMEEYFDYDDESRDYVMGEATE